MFSIVPARNERQGLAREFMDEAMHLMTTMYDDGVDSDALLKRDDFVYPVQEDELILQDLADEVQEAILAELCADLAAEDEAELEYLLELENEAARASARGTEHVGTVLLCPLCMDNRVLEHNGTIFCQCGMRLHMANGGLSLDQLQQVLFDLYERHHAVCSAAPRYAIEVLPFSKQAPTGRQQFLTMRCDACDLLEVAV